MGFVKRRAVADSQNGLFDPTYGRNCCVYVDFFIECLTQKLEIHRSQQAFPKNMFEKIVKGFWETKITTQLCQSTASRSSAACSAVSAPAKDLVAARGSGVSLGTKWENTEKCGKCSEMFGKYGKQIWNSIIYRPWMRKPPVDGKLPFFWILWFAMLNYVTNRKPSWFWGFRNHCDVLWFPYVFWLSSV